MATRRHPIIPALRDQAEVTPLATIAPPLGQCYRPDQRMPPHGVDLLFKLKRIGTHERGVHVGKTELTAMNADGYWWMLLPDDDCCWKTSEIEWWCLLRDVLDLVKPPLP